MGEGFPAILSSLRREKGVNQRHAAAELRISQALLSHYENGQREPGLEFVANACRYYNVSADYLLGISGLRSGFAYGADNSFTEHEAMLLESASEAYSALLDSLQASECSEDLKCRTLEYITYSIYRLFLALGAETSGSAVVKSALCDAKLKLNEAAVYELAEKELPGLDLPAKLSDLIKNVY